METLKHIGDVKGKKVIVRLGLNVPIEKGLIVDDYRILQMIPTLQFLREAGAKIIIISHIGRKKTETLKPVAEYLKKTFSVTFVPDIFDKNIHDTIELSKNGDIVFCENLRKWEGEKKNDDEFSHHIASLGDVFVNDAFPVAHREHASIVGIPKHLPSYAGIQFEKEVTNLNKALDPESPFVFILGGAKVETKLPLMEKFVRSADTVFVGGVLANDFYKAMGKEIGKSKTSDALPPLELLEKDNFILPQDVVIDRAGSHAILSVDELQKKDLIFDAGPTSVSQLIAKIKSAKLIVWNGPIGFCEGGFCDGTLKIAEAIAASDAYSIVGGGDSLAAIPDYVQNKFSFVSTGGGAMLDLLVDGSLPAIEALS